MKCSESFLLFAQADRSSNLGFVDARARFIEIAVAGQDLVIEQSPSLLRSDRAEGTTGASKSVDASDSLPVCASKSGCVPSIMENYSFVRELDR